MKKWCFIFCFFLSTIYVNAAEKLFPFRIDFVNSIGVGNAAFSELVYGDNDHGDVELKSDLDWSQVCVLLQTGIAVTLGKGFTCFVAVNFLPPNLPMSLIDEDFKNGKMWSHSEHPAKTQFSGDGCIGFGWKFLAAYSKEKQIRFFVEPAVRFNYFAYNHFAYDGSGYKINIFDEQYDHRIFTGTVIEYKLRLFSTQLLLNFYGEFNERIELQAGCGIGVYSKALVLDYHVLRQIKSYDQFNFYIFSMSFNFGQKFLITDHFGLFYNIDFLYSKSKRGKTTTHRLDADIVELYPTGSAGFRFSRFNFSLGVFARIARKH